MRALRIGVVGLLAAGMLVGLARPVAAAPPSNDTIAAATVITGLPFSDTVDTTDATTDADELAAAQPCVDIGAPAIEKAVWYTGTIVSEAVTVAVDVTASSYSAGIAIFAGPPSAATFVTCGPGVVSGPVTSGQTFYLMAFGDVPGSLGGTLEISVFEAVLPDVALTVDPIGHFDPRDGSATISGTAMCSGVTVAFINGVLRQPVGRFAIDGFFFAGIPCDGTTHTWTVDVIPDGGKFAGGKATVEAGVFACGVAGCAQDFVEQPMRLVR
jgi:hypothetical protein